MDGQTGEVEDLERILTDTNAEPIKITFAAIKYVTKNFAVVIGEGGFGVVYLGGLQNGMIAVKKLFETRDLSDKQFLDEVTCLTKVKHTNVVRFLGYCADTQGEVMEYDGKHRIVEVKQRLLCFEYVPNGNLHNYLKEKTYGYEWSVRYQIIKGICHGLHDIHQKHVYHLDLKPPNVLLGVNMEPKITDFGLSRYIGEQSTMVTKRIFGTRGYMAPEFIDKHHISPKSDIFSLGVIMINLLTGHSGCVMENWQTTIDIECPQMKRCIEIAEICVNTDPQNRPTTAAIIQSLNETETVDHASQTYKQRINEPINDPRSTLHEVVQKFRALPAKNLHEQAARLDTLLVELDVPECLLDVSKKPGRLPYQLLQSITGNFSDERQISRGGHASILKGILRQKNVTVKRHYMSIGDMMFRQEVKAMTMVRHKNILQFLGYCCHTEEEALEYEGQFIMAEIHERLLCFEYLSKGTLTHYLSDASCGLEWDVRFQIIKGICEGLHYVHKKHIAHLNIKPESVLLDDDMVPKLHNFHLSRCLKQNEVGEFEESTLNLVGSFGYLAPEFFHKGAITFKCDLYSLGFIITEILTGCRDGDSAIENVLDCWRARLGASSTTNPLLEQVRVCAEISIACRNDNPEKRPADMQRIIEMLAETEQCQF